MEHLLLFEAYMDKIGDGSFNTAFELDNDWIIKMPKTKRNPDNDDDDFEDEFENAKQALDHFKWHINFMKSNSDICPEVKLLSKNRAAIRKVDTILAKKEIEYIYNKYNKELDGQFDNYCWFPMELYNDDQMLEKFGIIINNSDPDKICLKWYNFLKILNTKFNPDEIDFDMDLHCGNFGIDNHGNIKLIDF